MPQARYLARKLRRLSRLFTSQSAALYRLTTANANSESPSESRAEPPGMNFAGAKP